MFIGVVKSQAACAVNYWHRDLCNHMTVQWKGSRCPLLFGVFYKLTVQNSLMLLESRQLVPPYVVIVGIFIIQQYDKKKIDLLGFSSAFFGT